MQRQLLMLILANLVVAGTAYSQTAPDRFDIVPPASVPLQESVAESAPCDLDASDPDDPSQFWRLRAFRYLDCVIALAERALAAQLPSEADTRDARVSLTRAEVEQIQRLALWARDAAARIGR